MLPRARPGTYFIRAHYFASDANRASTRTKVYATIYRGWGTKNEKVIRKAITLAGRKDMHDLAQVVVEGPSEVKEWPVDDLFGAAYPRGGVVRRP
jgi:hypothetical protein